MVWRDRAFHPRPCLGPGRLTSEKKTMPKKPRPLDAALRSAIRADGRTHYALGKAAEIAPSILDRFMLPAEDPRHRGLTLDTASRIASVLGLELVAAG